MEQCIKLVLLFIWSTQTCTEATTVNEILTEVPVDSISPDATRLDLSYNSITSLDKDQFQKFSGLISLKIVSNGLRNISDTAFCGTQLQRLVLAENNLKVFPNLSCIADTLTYFDFSYNPGEVMDTFNIKGMTHLKYIKLDVMPVEERHISHIAHVTQGTLNQLFLDNTGVKSIKVPLNGLTLLSLNNNELTRWPVIADSIKSTLTTLYLSYNNITSTSADSGQFFSVFTRLNTLFLNHNPYLGIWPNFTGIAGKLKKLKLVNTGLSELNVSELEMLTELRTVDISKNYISDIDPLICLRAFNTLEHLIMYKNPIAISQNFSNALNMWYLNNLYITTQKDMCISEYQVGPATLHIDNGDIPCTCCWQWLKRASTIIQSSRGWLAPLTCSAPTQMIGRFWNDVNADDVCTENPAITTETVSPTTEQFSTASHDKGTVGPTALTAVAETAEAIHIATEEMNLNPTPVVSSIHATSIESNATTEDANGAATSTSASQSGEGDTSVGSPSSSVKGSSTPKMLTHLLYHALSRSTGISHKYTYEASHRPATNIVTPSHRPPIKTVTSSNRPATNNVTSSHRPATDKVTSSQRLDTSTVTSVMSSADTPVSMVPGLSNYQLNMSFDTWLSWNVCSQSCGGGRQFSVKFCSLDTSEPCHLKLQAPSMNYTLGYSVRYQACNIQPCPQHGFWLSWGSWSPCSATCDKGTRLRRSECVGPSNGDKPCEDDLVEIEMCEMESCPSVVRRKSRSLLKGSPYTVSDERPSAQVLGSLGVICITVFSVIIILLDLSNWKQHWLLLRRNLKL